LDRSDPRGAEPFLRHAVQVRPSLGLAHLLLARSLESLSKTESQAEYREVLRLMPDSAEARAGLERLSQ
jgi:Tfp pilus assembly protein PilF